MKGTAENKDRPNSQDETVLVTKAQKISSEAPTELVHQAAKTVHSQPTTHSQASPESIQNAATIVAKHSGASGSVNSADTGSDLGRDIGIGTRIRDRFVLKELLGSGGMGSVYKALDLRKKEAGDTNPYIAIKLLNTSFEQHPKAFVSLQREAKKTQELAHPNIVTVYDFDRQGSTVFLTMEQLKGQPLNDIMRGRTSIQLSYSAKLDIVKAIASGLSYAHSKGIVHSDLKPANIFYTDDGRIKILDFGIARAANEELYQDGFDAGDLGALTFSYASPEMIRFEAPHPADDIYALGIITAELFGGRHPFSGKDAETAKKAGLAPDLSQIRSRAIRKQVRAALHFEREKRTPDAATFLKRLDRTLALPRQIVSLAALIAVALAANFYYLSTVETNEVAFEDLATADQNSVRQKISSAKTALQFNDIQAAVVAIDEAHAIHPSNAELTELKQEVTDVLRNAVNRAPSARQRALLLKDFQELQKYPAFKGMALE